MRWAWLLLTVTLAGCLGGDDPVAQEQPRLDLQISWIPEAPVTGQAVTFSVQVTSPVSGDSLESIKWKIGDDVHDTSRPVVFFDASGPYPVVVQVRSNATGLNQATANVDVLQGVTAVAPQPGPADPVAPPPVTKPDTPLAIVIEQQDNVVAFSYEWSQDATLVVWDFGDGTTSNDATPTHTYGSKGTYTVTLRASGDEVAEASLAVAITSIPSAFKPHVVVAIPDSGANPYHEDFFDASRTSHPCTYIQNFPCDVQQLPLSIGMGLSYQAAVQQDQALWQSMRPGTWYWIPKTVFVGFGCEDGPDGYCGLDDGSTVHGTGTTGSVITEAPGASLIFKEGGPDIAPFQNAGFPVDIYSVSWGWADPAVGLSAPLPLCGDHALLYIKSSGNEPGLSSLTDCWASHPDVLSIGGAYAQDNTQYAMSGKEPDFVSYYCRPAAVTNGESGTRTWCGTSFAAPTAAGAIAKVVLTIREQSGYLGGMDGDIVDPESGLDVATLREALRMTASYDPEPRYSDTDLFGVPLNPVAPCLQWSWGFLDADVVDATIDHLTGGTQGSKDAVCDTYMRAVETYKETVWG